MAELATIARPYAEALHQVVSGDGASRALTQLEALDAVLGDPQVRLLTDGPGAPNQAVTQVIVGAAATLTGHDLDAPVRNLLGVLVDGGRLAAFGEITRQFRSLMQQASGVSEAVIHSAHPIDDQRLSELWVLLEKRFGRRLAGRVEIEPELIGGIRVVVGDEVLDTSVRASLDQMKARLTA